MKRKTIFGYKYRRLKKELKRKTAFSWVDLLLSTAIGLAPFLHLLFEIFTFCDPKRLLISALLTLPTLGFVTVIWTLHVLELMENRAIRSRS